MLRVGSLVLAALLVSQCTALPDFDWVENDGYHLSAIYDTDESSIILGLLAGEAPVCVDPNYWPGKNGIISTTDHVLSVRKDGRLYQIDQIFIDGAWGLPVVRVNPGKVITAAMPVGRFQGDISWDGSEKIIFTPKVWKCE